MEIAEIWNAKMDRLVEAVCTSYGTLATAAAVSIRVRWEAGQHILSRRDGKGRLPDRVLDELAARYGYSRSTIGDWRKLAEKYPTEAELSTALESLRISTWTDVKRSLPDKHRIEGTTPATTDQVIAATEPDVDFVNPNDDDQEDTDDGDNVDLVNPDGVVNENPADQEEEQEQEGQPTPESADRRDLRLALVAIERIPLPPVALDDRDLDSLAKIANKAHRLQDALMPPLSEVTS